MMKELINKIDNLIVLILAFIAPIVNVIFAVMFMIIVDFITGIWKAKKKKEPITSHRMKDTVPKLVLYILALIVGHVAEIYLIAEIPFVRIISGFIGLVEIKSIFENINGITGLNIWAELKGYLTKRK